MSWRFLRALSYEIFIWSHQALGVVSLYSVWQHVPARRTSYRIYLYVSVAILTTTVSINAALVLFRGGLFSHRRCTAVISSTCGMVKIRLQLPRPLIVEPGQYINLWLPSASFWAFTQAHPFMVMSWQDAPQETFDIFIQPRRGFTRNVAGLASPLSQPVPRWAMFGGPYGRNIAIGRYETVLLVANGAGIAALIPFLKKLIHGYHTRQAFTRRIHLVWQIHDLGMPACLPNLY
jgi:predicted ferric reductase